MNKPIHKIWWMEEGKPVLYKGQVCYPSAVIKITQTLYKIILSCAEINNGAQFIVETNLHTDFQEDFKFDESLLDNQKP